MKEGKQTGKILNLKTRNASLELRYFIRQWFVKFSSFNFVGFRSRCAKNNCGSKKFGEDSSCMAAAGTLDVVRGTAAQGTSTGRLRIAPREECGEEIFSTLLLSDLFSFLLPYYLLFFLFSFARKFPQECRKLCIWSNIY